MQCHLHDTNQRSHQSQLSDNFQNREKQRERKKKSKRIPKVKICAKQSAIMEFYLKIALAAITTTTTSEAAHLLVQPFI